MQAAILENPLLHDCLGKLERILALSMETAEAASAQGNHKVVLQAIREGTRIVTLIFKMTSTPRTKNCRAVPALLPDAMLAALLPEALLPPGKGSQAREREKSGKLPGKTPRPEKSAELHQTDGHGKNISGGNAASCRLSTEGTVDFSGPLPGNWVQELDAGRLDVNVLHAMGAGRPFPDKLGLAWQSAGPALRPGLVCGEAPATR